MTVFLPYLNLLSSMSPLLNFLFIFTFLPNEEGKKFFYLYPLELLIQAVKYFHTSMSEEKLKDKREETFWSNLLLQHTSLQSPSPLPPLSHSPPSTRPSHSSSHSSQFAPSNLNWKNFHLPSFLPAGSPLGQFNLHLAKPPTSPLRSLLIHLPMLHFSIINIQELLW